MCYLQEDITGGQKRASDPWKLELLTDGNDLLGVLGTEPGSSAGATSFLKCSVISLAFPHLSSLIMTKFYEIPETTLRQNWYWVITVMMMIKLTFTEHLEEAWHCHISLRLVLLLLFFQRKQKWVVYPAGEHWARHQEHISRFQLSATFHRTAVLNSPRWVTLLMRVCFSFSSSFVLVSGGCILSFKLLHRRDLFHLSFPKCLLWKQTRS